jgi:hypothetical protein
MSNYSSQSSVGPFLQPPPASAESSVRQSHQHSRHSTASILPVNPSPLRNSALSDRLVSPTPLMHSPADSIPLSPGLIAHSSNHLSAVVAHQSPASAGVDRRHSDSSRQQSTTIAPFPQPPSQSFMPSQSLPAHHLRSARSEFNVLKASHVYGSLSGQSWLLRLFQSDYFNTWIAVSYLHKYVDSVGIQHYLCRRLSDEFPVDDIQFLLPQLWQVHAASMVSDFG